MGECAGFLKEVSLRWIITDNNSINTEKKQLSGLNVCPSAKTFISLSARLSTCGLTVVLSCNVTQAAN